MDKNIANLISDYVDKNKSELFANLTDLIGFDTQNNISFGKEEECQRYIKKRYEEMGLPVDFYTLTDVDGLTNHIDYLDGRGADCRQNVCATLLGEVDTRIMISAHTDTMPYGDLKAWTVDPFGGILQDGRIYGLGSNDNKYGSALMMFLAKLFLDLGIKPYYSYDFLSYADEEFGGGNGALAASLKNTYETTISLDSGNYELWTAAIGGCGYSLNIKTIELTDSSEIVLNAIFVIKQELDKFASERRKELNGNPLYVGSDMSRSAFRYFDVAIGNQATNLNQGVLHFGFYTSLDKSVVLRQLNDCIQEARKKLDDKVEISEIIPSYRYFHYLETDLNSLSLNYMKKCAEMFVDHEVQFKGACMSDLSLFMKYASADSFGFGVLRDFSLYGGAHQPDEFVDCQEFINLTKAVGLFIATYK